MRPIKITVRINEYLMARDIFGNRKLTKEDKYTQSNITFSQTDEVIEYIKMALLIIGALAYLYHIFT